MKLQFHSYRFAEEVLSSGRFSSANKEALEILSRLPAIKVWQPPWSDVSRKPKKTRFSIDQDAMNKWLDDQFGQAGWERHPKIVPGTNLAADYRKD